jgi:hypothetical protein
MNHRAARPFSPHGHQDGVKHEKKSITTAKYSQLAMAECR